MKPPRPQLRAQLDELTEDEFLDLCQSYFASVYKSRGEAERRPAFTRRLLEYVEQRDQEDTLLDAMRRIKRLSDGTLPLQEAMPLPPANEPAADRQAPDAIRAYCRNLEEAFALVDIVGAPISDDSAPTRLEQLYVEQALSPQPVSENATPDPKLPAAVDVFRETRRLVVLGDPGGGKSSLVQWITWQFAVANFGRVKPDGWPARLGFHLEKPTLPLPFILRELKIRDGITWDELWRGFLDQTRQRPLNGTVLCPFLDDGRALFLLDGLDEISNPAARRSLRDAVHEGMRRHPNCRWLLTARVIGYDEVPFHTDSRSALAAEWIPGQDKSSLQHSYAYYLAPFNDACIKDFAHKWYVCRATSEMEAQRKAADLAEAVFRDPSTTSLARVPFLLTLMATVHRNNVTLPNGRARLYKLITDAYVEKREADKRLTSARFPAADQWACLMRVGLEMQLRRTAATESKEEGALLASEKDVTGWLAVALKQDARRAAEFLDHLGRRTGLLLPRGEGRYGFIHLSFLEFFAACYLRQEITSLAWLLNQQAEIPAVAHRAQLHRYAADPRWQVPLLFVCELLAADGRRDYLKERFFPTLFGNHFADVAGGKWKRVWRSILAWFGRTVAEGPSRGVLLARLVVDPHAGWDEKAGWDDPLRRRALDACCWAEVAKQGLDEIDNWDHTPLIAQALLSGEGEPEARIVGALVGAFQKADLRALNLSGTGVTNLEPLRGHNALQSLDLTGTGVTNLEPLRGLNALWRLDLSGTGVTNLEPLRGLTALQWLDLESTGVTNLEPLEGLEQLMFLDLIQTPVTERAVAQLQQALPRCQISVGFSAR